MSNNDNFSVRVEGLSKRYVVPHRDESRGRMGRVAAHMREFFPFMGRDETDYFWSLRDVSFEVKPGEILGILGRNGSGKSTLLKILSGVTQPTAGRAELRGRVGSLLEVGTGFHPDLTGRENVFMSGVLLGLSRKEIAARFDEIVDFSGIEQFIDVPVKRYSSGMYVRLAYAVASLLRSDILILDEVMAVADLNFQKRAEKNINTMLHSGRSVLFVSHNVELMRRVCTHGILMDAGSIQMQGPIDDVADEYQRRIYKLVGLVSEDFSKAAYVHVASKEGLFGPRQKPIIHWVETRTSGGESARQFCTGDEIVIRIGYRLPDEITHSIYLSVFFINDIGERVFVCHSHNNHHESFQSLEGVVECRVPELRVFDGVFSVAVDIGVIDYSGPKSLDWVPGCTSINVRLGDYFDRGCLINNQGYFAQKSNWTQVSEVLWSHDKS